VTDARDPDVQNQRPGRPAPGKKALGKGLGALIGESRAALGRSGAPPTLSEGRLRELPLADISVNRRQPRRTFSDDELQELAASIKALGVVQPVVVRPLQAEGQAAEGVPAPTGVRFELIAGERRLRAAKLAGLEYIPALVRPADEISSLEIALAENVAREDLNAIEEALAYAALVDEFGLTHERIAELVGRSRVAVTNLLRLLDLPDDVQAMIERGDLTEGHGRALLALPDHGERRRIARLVVTEGLTVRQVEALVRKLNEGPGGVAATARPSAGQDFTELADELYGVFEAPVRIRAGKRGGSIQIRFKDAAELRRLVELLRSLG
jgi:ParB family transcriptional regulator, chromosome partitioning protein